MKKSWIRTSACAVLGIAAWCETTLAQNSPPGAVPPGTQRPQNAPPGAPQILPGGGLTGRPQQERGAGGANPVQELKDAGLVLFKLADVNNDGMISEKEATDAGNLLVGGYFFRADANGDGVVSKEESQQAFNALLQQQPLLRLLWNRTEKAQREGTSGSASSSEGPKDPIRKLGSLLDSNDDKKLEATEVRKAVQTAVRGYFDTADTNRDGQLTQAEIRAASVTMANQMVQGAFDAADSDHNGSLSESEFGKAIEAPAKAIFRAIDANGDGQLSKEEMQQANRIIFVQLQMLRAPDASNAFGSPAAGESNPAGAANPRGNPPRSR